jgi:hypothetical protein
MPPRPLWQPIQFRVSKSVVEKLIPGGHINWSVVIQWAATIFYLVLILEVYPSSDVDFTLSILIDLRIPCPFFDDLVSKPPHYVVH